MSDLVKTLIGSVNVAARSDERPYIGPRLPMCNCEGVEWKDMSPEARWNLCVAHLREQDSDFDEFLQVQNECETEQSALEFVLFGSGTAIRLINAVQDDCVADVMKIVRAQTLHDIDGDIAWFFDQGDELWDALFDYKIIIPEHPIKD